MKLKRLVVGTLVTVAVAVVSLAGTAAFGAKKPKFAPLIQKSSCRTVNLQNPPATPVKIRVAWRIGTDGDGSAMLMEPGVAPAKWVPNQGKWYTLEVSHPTSGAIASEMFLAGQVDIYNDGTIHQWTASNQGIKAKAIATSIINKIGTSQPGWFAIRNDGEIPWNASKRLPDFRALRGKVLPISGIGSPSELYQKAMLLAGGGYPGAAAFPVMPFPAQYVALINKQVAMVPVLEPQATVLKREKAPIHIFSALTVLNKLARGGLLEHDVLNLMAGDAFVAKNKGAVCAFLADLNRVNNWWRQNPVAGRRALVAAKMVIVDPGVYYAPDFPKVPIPEPGMPVNVTAGVKLANLARGLGVITKEQYPDYKKIVSPLANTR